MYWELCRKYGLTCADVWYKEVPDEVRVSKDGMVTFGRIGVSRQHRKWNIINVTVLHGSGGFKVDFC